MKIRSLLSVVGFAISFLLPTVAQQTKTPDPQLREQLLAFVTKYQEAINNGDAAAAAAFFAEDAVLVNDTGPVYGQEAIEKYYAGVFQDVIFSNYIITVDQNYPQIIGKAGDEAWSTGEWRSTVRGENFGPIEQKGYWSVTDIRKGDATKIRMLTCNVIPVPPAPALTNAVSSSAQEQKAVDPEVRHQIDAAGMKFRGAMHKQDAAAAADLYALNALKVVDWAAGTLSGRGAIEKDFAAYFASSPSEVVGKLVQMYPIGNEIVFISEWSSGPFYGHSVRIYLRDADTWKIRLEYDNSSGVPR